MNRLVWSAMLFFSLAAAWPDVVCQWNFNSLPPDDTTSTGRTTPSVGSGTATLIGGTTESFAAGASKDPATTDNSSWTVTKFPQVMVSNLMAGVRFKAGTAGYESISLSWAQQNSSTASRYARVQYSIDGVTFQDLPAFAILKESTWTNLVFNLWGIPGVDNNPNFAFQILTEFELTAAGGLPGFVPTAPGSSYLPSGTIKFDIVTISGTPVFDGNTAPFISSEITDQVLSVHETTDPLPFNVLDAEDPAVSLQTAAVSSDPAVIPSSNITFGGYGANRTVTVQAGSVAGTSTITIYVLDSGAKLNSLAFAVTVEPADRAPTLTCPATTYTQAGFDTAPLALTIMDPETPAANLVVGATAENSTLLPPSSFIFDGSGTNRTLVIRPAAGGVGATPVTLAVNDGPNTATCMFPCVVLPSPQTILYDSFNYADGSLVANSGALWLRRSGSAPDCLVGDGRLRLSQTRTEDVFVPLHGGPYETNVQTALYVSFKLQTPSLPRILPEYFAHFVSGGSLISRLYIGTTNAVEGCYRLYVGNSSDSQLGMFPMSMNRNVLYTIVLRYDVDAGSTRLWVDPQTEASPSVAAGDVLTPVRVNSFGFRQSSGIGSDLMIDELKIGLTYESVTGVAGAATLRFSRNGPQIVFSWDDPEFRLQSAANPSGLYTNVPGAISPWQVTPAGRAFYRLMKPEE